MGNFKSSLVSNNANRIFTFDQTPKQKEESKQTISPQPEQKFRGDHNISNDIY